MKKLLFTGALFGVVCNITAQIFNAGFENNNGVPLSAFKKINIDQNKVAIWAPVQEFNDEAWIQFFDGFDNKIAFSTSNYDPAGQSNDWLITPKISIPATAPSPTLYWKAKSYDFELLDGYSILVSTTTDEPSSFVELLKMDVEKPYDFSEYELDLSAYRGKDIFLAFVNNTNAGYYLALDDLYISESANCLMPGLNVSVKNLTKTGFEVSWNATGGISKYDVGLTDFNTPVQSLGIQTSYDKIFANLHPGTRYQFFLKNADCGSGWRGPKSIFTPTSLPYYYGFEYSAENYGEYDSDGWISSTWLNGNSASSAASGSGYVFNNTSKTYAKNDWLYSYPLWLEEGEAVHLSFKAAMGNANATPAKLKITVGTKPEKDADAHVISEIEISGNTYKSHKLQYTAKNSGVHYFGFGNVTPAVQINAALRLDDIAFEKASMAVQDLAIAEISVYPNPVVEELFINAKKAQIKLVELYSADGKLLSKITNSSSVKFAKLPAGIYLLKIQTEKGTIHKTIIKK